MGNSNQARTSAQNSNNKLLVGFENKSLTLCYANSIFQVMFHHPVFVDIIMNAECPEEGLIIQLRKVYKNMISKKQKMSVSTVGLMDFIEKKSGVFDKEYHQDCHEFYFWMMDRINEELKEQNKKNGLPKEKRTKLQEEFYSKRITRIECFNCHAISEREEEEVDLSLVLPEPNVSLNYCIEQYSAGEKLTGKNKFKCDKCGELQDAEKKTLIKTLPNFLSVHLRRFKYDEFRKGITKLLWLIPFPFKIKLRANYESKEEEKKPQMMYKLVGVVAHIGNGGNVGHYISYIKINKKWYLFNDDEINEVDDFMLESLWGYKGITKCGYIIINLGSHNYSQELMHTFPHCVVPSDKILKEMQKKKGDKIHEEIPIQMEAEE